MKFFYTALTTDNKKITGVLDTPDRDTAQGELHKMGVAILVVNEISDEEAEKIKSEQEAEKAKSGIKTYLFLARNENGKEVEGTIDAADDYSAYKRLRQEYQFKVVDLALENATEEEKNRAKALLPKFEEQLTQGQAFERKDVKKSASQEAGELGEENMDQEIIEEVDRVIVNAKRTLESHPTIYSTDLLREIQNTLGELERVRTSNNLKHITEISNDLYSLISTPDMADPETLKSKEFQVLLSEMHDSALVKKEFELYKRAVEASGLRKSFENIAKRLREMTASKDEGEEPTGVWARFKAKVHNALERKPKMKPKMNRADLKEDKKSKFGLLVEETKAYFSAASPILRQTRQHELINTIKAFFGKGNIKAAVGTEAEKTEGAEPKKRASPTQKRAGRDFTGFFVEMDSFVGWLLSFYILYFFMVGFSIEKGIGLNREFVYKTLKTPLLINATLLLLMLHFFLRFSNLHLRGKAVTSLFLFFFGAGAYILGVVNF